MPSEQPELEHHIQQVSEQWSAAISKLGMKTVDQLADENSDLKVNIARQRDLLQLCYNAFKTLQEHGCEIRLGDESATVRIKKELAHDPY